MIRRRNDGAIGTSYREQRPTSETAISQSHLNPNGRMANNLVEYGYQSDIITIAQSKGRDAMHDRELRLVSGWAALIGILLELALIVILITSMIMTQSAMLLWVTVPLFLGWLFSLAG